MRETADRPVAAPNGPALGNEQRPLREDAMSFGAPAPQYWVKGRDT